MEYEIYYICNLLGFFIVLIIVFYHFVEADKELKPSRNKLDESEEKKVK